MQSQYVCTPFSINISILTNPPTQWHPLPPIRPVSFAFHRQYGCSRCVYGKRETGAKREELVLGSSLRSRLKILLFARYPSRLSALFSALFLSSSFTSFLPPRFFWISVPRAYLARNPADPLCPSLAPNRRSLAINKKRKKKK